MYDSNSKGISYTAGFFMLIGFCVAGLIIGGLVSIPIWTAMTGKSILAMSKADPADSSAYKVIQAVSTMIGFFLPAILGAVLLNRKPLQLMGFGKKINALQIFLVIIIMLAAAFFASGTLGYLNKNIPMPHVWQPFFQKLEDEYFKQVNAIMQLKNPLDYLIGLVIMGFLPALFEETLFRGGLQNFLTRATRNPLLSIIIVSFIFSIVHLSYYGFLPRMFLGIALGLIYHYTGSLWLCIIGHFFNNGLALTAYYFSSGGALKQITEETPTLNTFYIGLVALPVFIILLVILKRNSMVEKQAGISLNDIRDKAPWERDSS
jgi:uncharacterized protein